MAYKFRQSLALGSLLFLLCSYQIIKTQLRVTVLDDLGNIRKGAEVTLYHSVEDYNNDKTAYGPITTKKRSNFTYLN